MFQLYIFNLTIKFYSLPEFNVCLKFNKKLNVMYAITFVPTISIKLAPVIRRSLSFLFPRFCNCDVLTLVQGFIKYKLTPATVLSEPFLSPTLSCTFFTLSCTCTLQGVGAAVVVAESAITREVMTAQPLPVAAGQSPVACRSSTTHLLASNSASVACYTACAASGDTAGVASGDTAGVASGDTASVASGDIAAIGGDIAAVDGDAAAVGGDAAAVGGDAAAVGGDAAAVGGDIAAVGGDAARASMVASAHWVSRSHRLRRHFTSQQMSPHSLCASLVSQLRDRSYS